MLIKCYNRHKQFSASSGPISSSHKGKVQKKRKTKLTSVSFMYVCVAGNGEMLVFFPFFPQQ